MRGVIFLDDKFCLTINSKLGTARLAREWLARTQANWSRFNRRRPDLSIRLKRLSRAAFRISYPKVHRALGETSLLPILRSTIKTGPTLLSARSSKTKDPRR